MSMFDDLISGYPSDIFVDPIEYDCTICLGICKDTVSLKPCGHIFCKECIKVWAKNKTVCPNCKVNFNEILESPWHDSKIIGMTVKCKYNTNGCNYKCSLRNINDHIKICEYGPIECKFNCNKKFIASQLDEHMNTCDNRIVKCIVNCNKDIRYCDMNNHLQQECDNVLVNCNNMGCSMNFLRKEKPHHMNNCKYELVKCSTMYCDDIVLRKDYHNHISDNVYHMTKKISFLEQKLAIAENYKKIIQHQLLHNNIKLIWFNNNINCKECRLDCTNGYKCESHCDYSICEDCVLYKQYNIMKQSITRVKVKYTDNNIIGKKVIKGRDWKWGEQDCKKEGVIISFGDTQGWIKVKWSDHNTNTYRAGIENKYDLYYL